MKKKKRFGNVLLLAAILLLIGVLFFEADAVRNLRGNYEALSGKAISGEERSVIAYDDHLLAVMAFGSTDTVQGMQAFLRDALANFDKRIMAAGLIYTAVITALTALFWARRYVDNKGKHLTAVILCGIAVPLLFYAAVFCLMRLSGIPVYLPNRGFIAGVFIGTLSILAGSCVLAVCLRSVSRKGWIVIIALMLIGATYLFGFVCELGLLSKRTFLSYDYLFEENVLSEDGGEECVLDESGKVITVDGTAYPLEELPNPDSFTGAKRAGAIALEAVNPYSAVTLPLAHHVLESELPPITIALYFAKDMLWILLSVFIGKKRSGLTEGE